MEQETVEKHTSAEMARHADSSDTIRHAEQGSVDKSSSGAVPSSGWPVWFAPRPLVARQSRERPYLCPFRGCGCEAYTITSLIGDVLEDHFDGDADSPLFDAWMKVHMLCTPETGRSPKIRAKHQSFIEQIVQMENSQ